jgi:hypothetical protein
MNSLNNYFQKSKNIENTITNNNSNNKFSLRVSQPYCSSYNFNNNNWIPKNMYWINNYNKFSDISKYIVKEK